MNDISIPISVSSSSTGGKVMVTARVAGLGLACFSHSASVSSRMIIGLSLCAPSFEDSSRVSWATRISVVLIVEVLEEFVSMREAELWWSEFRFRTDAGVDLPRPTLVEFKLAVFVSARPWLEAEVDPDALDVLSNTLPQELEGQIADALEVFARRRGAGLMTLSVSKPTRSSTLLPRDRSHTFSFV
jgi:hypothetical protein